MKKRTLKAIIIITKTTTIIIIIIIININAPTNNIMPFTPILSPQTGRFPLRTFPPHATLTSQTTSHRCYATQ